MRNNRKVRMNRLFGGGRCLDVAIDHGVCNEPSFLNGLEDMSAVVKALVAAAPDAIQMNYGQADLLQDVPGKDKPSLVMRLDMGNPYNRIRHRHMWAVLQNEAEPLIGALAPATTLHVIEGGDHSFKVTKKATGRTLKEVMAELADTLADWTLALPEVAHQKTLF